MTAVSLDNLRQAQLPAPLAAMVRDIAAAGGTVYAVGGWVRDRLLGREAKDMDLEVHGLAPEALEKVLSGHGRPSFVGRAFGVFTMTREGERYDFSLPRTEVKDGPGHKGFRATPDPALGFERAAARRDFTVNAIGLKLPEMELVDPHGGLADLERGLLRHVSPAFSEDPLRALRAVQFAARFGFDIHPETQALCARQPLDELPCERLFEEWKKLLLKAEHPSIGLEWLRKMDLLRFFPELGALVGVPQDPEWHPEGDVWTHNNLVVDAAARLRDREMPDEGEGAEFARLEFMLAALCHDLGKPATTAFEDGRWRSLGHDNAGEKPARAFLGRLTRETGLVEGVVALVREHLKPALLHKQKDKVTTSAIRRLSLKVDIRKLVRVAKADHFGRALAEAREERFEAGDWLLEESENLQVLEERPKPYLTGKMLLELGMTAGPAMGELIRESFELQLDGRIADAEAARVWAGERLGRRAG